MNPATRIEFRCITDDDKQSFLNCGMDVECCFRDKDICMEAHDAEGHKGILFTSKAYLDKYGMPYIASHAMLRYSEFCDQWFVNISLNDFYNDPERNKPTSIHVVRVGSNPSDGAEIYARKDLNMYYLRQVSSREPFAKWFLARKHGDTFQNLACIRPNTTFVCCNESETVRYDDWNETAAYSDTFNPNFEK